MNFLFCLSIFNLCSSFLFLGVISQEEDDDFEGAPCESIQCGTDAAKTKSPKNPDLCTCTCPDGEIGQGFSDCKVVRCGMVAGKFRTNGQFVFSLKENITVSNHWPWMVSLGHWDDKDENKWIHKCGASIITENHVLTAAHCAKMVNLEDWRILIGISDFDHIDETEHDDYEREISEIFIHDLFDSKHKNSSYYDVAILKVSESIVFSPDVDNNVGPVCLPKVPYAQADELASTAAVLSGWGALQYGDTEPSRILRTAVVTVYSQRHCDELHENSENKQLFGPLIDKVIPEKFQSNIFCAGNPETNESACYGDSGGPLVQFQGSKVNSNHYVQIGIVQGGIKCGDPYFPSIFSNLGDAAVLEFVLQKSGLDSDAKFSVPEVNDNKVKCSQEGECLQSTLLGHSTQVNEAECLTVCKETNGCLWYTYDKDKELCLTHSNCFLLSTTSCKGCISGHATC